MGKIRAIIRRPDEPLAHSAHISNTLENLQRLVGGYIEAVSIGDGLIVICNEEGRLRGLPYNCTLNGIDFVGEIAIVGEAGELFADVPITTREFIKKYLLHA